MNSKNIFGIITYLNENKEQYPKDVLTAELKKAGYAEGDIAESIAQVFDGVVPPPAPTIKTSFWNFKDKKVYTKASEKWADFLFGVFVSLLFAYIVFGTLSLHWLLLAFLGIIPLLIIIIVIYLFNRRRFVFYGMIAPAFIIPLIHILLLVVIQGLH